MHEFKIISQDFREGVNPDGSPLMRTYYSFHVSDGKDWFPSMKWFPICTVAGLPKTYYVERCINRLKAGASREANGDALLVMQGADVVGLAKVKGGKSGRGEVFQDSGPAKVEQVKSHGGQVKPREERKKWKAKVDGAELCGVDGKPVEFPDEKSARAATAIHAFLTRGKVGRISHARERLEELVPGGSVYAVWTCCKENSIRAAVDGVEYAIGWAKDSSGQWFVEKVKPMA